VSRYHFAYVPTGLGEADAALGCDPRNQRFIPFQEPPLPSSFRDVATQYEFSLVCNNLRNLPSQMWTSVPVSHGPNYLGGSPRFASSRTDFVVADLSIADLVGEPHAAGGFVICLANTRELGPSGCNVDQ
jgi:hypothetical protein